MVWFGIYLIHTTKIRMHSSRMHTVRCSGHLSCHAHPLPCTPPRTEFLTHACENIIFLQPLLRAVIINFIPSCCHSIPEITPISTSKIQPPFGKQQSLTRKILRSQKTTDWSWSNTPAYSLISGHFEKNDQ